MKGWQIAVAVGVPVALVGGGVGVYFVVKSGRKKEEETTKRLEAELANARAQQLAAQQQRPQQQQQSPQQAPAPAPNIFGAISGIAGTIAQAAQPIGNLFSGLGSLLGFGKK